MSISAITQDYKTLQKEVDNYFQFISLSQKVGVKLGSSKVEEDIKKVLKGTFYLLLYNLIEATVRKLIFEIIDTINIETITFQSLSETVQKAWLRVHKDSLRSCKDENFTLKLYDIITNCLSSNPLYFEKKFGGGGNLDSKKIKDICFEYGVNFLRECKDIDDIKEKRNRLAHGEDSFSEIGRDVVIGDLRKAKKETYLHLNRIIKATSTYLLKQQYKAKIEKK